MRTAPAALVVLAAALAAGPALAADPAPVQTPLPNGDPALTAKVDAAIANATSYRIAVHAPDITVNIRTFGPERVQIDSTTGSAKSESIIVGTAMYYRPENAAWQTFTVPPVRRVRHNRLYMGLADALLQPLPDRVEDGIAYGSFRSLAAGNGGVPGVMDCTYDRASFRPRACRVTLLGSTATIDVTYDGWDDPTNAVEPPLGVPPPAPSPAPAPARAPH